MNFTHWLASQSVGTLAYLLMPGSPIAPNLGLAHPGRLHALAGASSGAAVGRNAPFEVHCHRPCIPEWKADDLTRVFNGSAQI